MSWWRSPEGARRVVLLAIGALSVGCSGRAGYETGDDGNSQPAGIGAPKAQPPGLGWSVRDDTPYGRMGASAVVDTAGERLIVFGQGGTDIWSLALSGENELKWSQILPEGDAPAVPARAGVYDRSGKRILMLVDTLDTSHPNYDDVELWQLSLEGTPRFARLAAQGPQPGRELAGAQLALDTAGDRLFAMGGALGNCGVWQLSLGEGAVWLRVADAFDQGFGLCPFNGGSLVFDAPRQRLVAFGSTEVWELPLAEPVWASLGRDPCGGRFFAAPAFDEARGRIVYGGGHCPLSTFTLATNEWQDVRPLEKLSGAAAAVDVARDRILYFSGSSKVGNATWQLPLGSLELATLTPNTRGTPIADGSTMIWDPRRNAAVSFGGEEPRSTRARSLDSAATWRVLATDDGPEGWNQGAIYDPVAQQILAFGGTATDGRLHRLASDKSAWEVLDLQPGPQRRSHAVTIHDSARRRLVVRGGTAEPFALGAARLDDVWSLSLEGELIWTRLEPVGDGPGPRESEVGAYDPLGHRLIVFGGYSDSHVAASQVIPITTQDLHSLSFDEEPPRWTPLAAFGTPPNLPGPLVVYDAAGRRLIYVELDGFGPAVAALELSDTPTWHTFCAMGTPPARNFGPSKLALVDDALFVAIGNGTFRFDLKTPYCD